VQEADGVQEVEVEIDGGQEVNSVQELVDGGQGLIAARGWR
jgi:hypothetical protein